MEQSNSSGLWQGLQNIMDYKATPTQVNIDTSLAEALNMLYGHFSAYEPTRPLVERRRRSP